MDPEQPPPGSEDFEERPTAASEPRQPLEQQSIGPYRLLQKLGEGGMGEVWLAEQVEPVRRKVAIKLIKLGMDSKQVIARFEAERQALALMEHPAVARVYDAGTTARGAPFFVMEYVRGIPITEYCDQHRLNPRERLDLFREVCEGVQHAHQKAIIHRDLKPSNILVAEQDGRRFPKIIDFGLAKATAQKLTEKTMFTELGALVGTPEYMSPEQANLTGEDVDTRTDVYSLGVILYELLVGALPFDATTLRNAGFEGIRRIIREEEPKRPSTRLSTLGDRAGDSARARNIDLGALRRQLRGDLDWITLKALEKDRARRYGSPSDLARDVARYLSDEPVLASPPSAAYLAKKFVRRHRGGVLAASLLFLALLAGVIGTTAGLVRARKAEAEAQAQSRASERVSRFLASILQNIDPVRLGRDLQADLEGRKAKSGSLENANFVDISSGLIDRQIFAPALRMIDTTLADQPGLAARLGYTIGESYRKGLQLYDPAVASLRASVRQGWWRTASAGAPDWEPVLSLAMALKQQGNQSGFLEAESLYRVVLADQKRRLGDDRPPTLVTATQLGDTYRMLLRDAEAESLLRDAVGRMRRSKDLEKPELYYALNDLALVLGAHPAKRAEADTLYLEAIAGLTREFGPGHYEVLNTELNRARLLMSMRRWNEAEIELRHMIEAGRSTIGNESDLTLQAQVVRGMALGSLHRNEEAIDVYREALRVMRRPGSPDRDVALATLSMGIAMGAAGRLAEGRKLMEDFADAQLRQNSEQSRRWYQTAAYDLACLEAVHGRRAAAFDWLRRLADTGFLDANQLADDPDLETLHGREFDSVLGRMRANPPAARQVRASPPGGR